MNSRLGLLFPFSCLQCLYTQNVSFMHNKRLMHTWVVCDCQKLKIEMHYRSQSAYYKKHTGKPSRLANSSNIQSWIQLVESGPTRQASFAYLTQAILISCISSGIPHRVMQDDVYKGISIPEGSLVFANTRYAIKP